MPRGPATPFIPRSSQMGGYMECSYRAVLDRMLAEGTLDASTKDQEPAPYADLGTCIHFVLMDGLRCKFPNDPKAHQYTATQLSTASGLFGSDEKRTVDAIHRCAKYAAAYVPKAPDGVVWRAETKIITKLLTGTVDFLSQDGSVLGDLKTTTKPPKNNRIKNPHLIQMICYHILTGAKTGWVLYVDSLRASWNTLAWIDFTTDAMVELTGQVVAYAKFLRTRHLMDFGVPQMGEHCSDNFCPYRKVCKERFQPQPGVHTELSLPVGTMATTDAKSLLSGMGK